jgi:hypothetical protein
MPRRLAALLAVAVLAGTSPAALAQGPPRGEHPRPLRQEPDTTHVFPRWLRPYFEFGGAWMTAPDYIRKHYESGQGFGLGLEARAHDRWALRGTADYQMLLANDLNTLYYLGQDPVTGLVVVDTLQLHSQTTGWFLTGRAEAGARLFGDFWATGGAGGGYMRSGLVGQQTDLNSLYPILGSGAVKNGWGWLWTTSIRYDFQPAPRVPLGFEVRTTNLRRGSDDVRTWAIRICWRVPYENGPPDPGRRR